MVLLTTTLLVGVSGCDNNQESSFFNTSVLKIDDVQYIVRLDIATFRHERDAFSFITFHRSNCGPLLTYESKQRGSRDIIKKKKKNGEEVIAKTETLYFFQDGIIVLGTVDTTLALFFWNRYPSLWNGLKNDTTKSNICYRFNVATWKSTT
jgi:hypothetical protein